jgi:hypothetical protein
MFKCFKTNPVKKLKKKYSYLLELAMKAQRNGNIKLYSELTFKSEEILKEIDELERSKK